MISGKQLAANRENAKKSTGPKSEESKKIVSQNALRHGLTGQVTLMPDEDREAHDKFCAAIVESLAPEGALEIQLAQSIAEDNWRMNRGRAIETNLFAIGNFGDPRPDAEVADGEQVGFDGAAAVHAPVVLGDGLGELDFKGSFGSEAFDNGGAEFVVGFAVFVGHEGYLAGEAVAEGVLAHDFFGFFGFGAG